MGATLSQFIHDGRVDITMDYLRRLSLSPSAITELRSRKNDLGKGTTPKLCVREVLLNFPCWVVPSFSYFCATCGGNIQSTSCNLEYRSWPVLLHPFQANFHFGKINMNSLARAETLESQWPLIYPPPGDLYMPILTRRQNSIVSIHFTIHSSIRSSVRFYSLLGFVATFDALKPPKLCFQLSVANSVGIIRLTNGHTVHLLSRQ